MHPLNFTSAWMTNQITSQKAQLRAPLSPRKTAWTDFNPHLYISQSPSVGATLVESGNC